MAPLVRIERPADGTPEGLLVLHHGRGTSERDLAGLADALDPERRLRVVLPRGPLQLPGSPGYHWYLVPRVGYPDPDSFRAARAALAEFHDELWADGVIGPERTVLGGFSMGTVMSYTMALDGARPAVAGILAYGGFVPTVEGWEPSFADRTATRVLIAHGRLDPIIDVGFAQRAHELIEAGGLEVRYCETDVGHEVGPQGLAAGRGWLRDTFLGAAGY